jgi:hypothetical protein
MTDEHEIEIFRECAKRWRKMRFHILANMAEASVRGEFTPVDPVNEAIIERDKLIDLIKRMRAQWIDSWAKDECLRAIGEIEA